MWPACVRAAHGGPRARTRPVRRVRVGHPRPLVLRGASCPPLLSSRCTHDSSTYLLSIAPTPAFAPGQLSPLGPAPTPARHWHFPEAVWRIV